MKNNDPTRKMSQDWEALKNKDCMGWGWRNESESWFQRQLDAYR